MWPQLPTLTTLSQDKLGQLSSVFQCHLKGCLPCLLCFQQNIVHLFDQSWHSAVCSRFVPEALPFSVYVATTSV